MLQIHNLSKSFGAQMLLEDITLQMSAGERLGLVGRNGHGKSTLFRMILGEETPDSGTIIFPRGYRVGHLAQHLSFTRPTLLEEACLGLPAEDADAHYKAEAALFGLGFSKADMECPPSSFSGGFQIRLNLAKVLVSGANLLLLDEPTNYLDIISIRWLARFLRSWRDELILITHDRDFMDGVTTHTAAIHRATVRKIKGGTAKLYAQIAQDEEIEEKTRANDDKKRKDIEQFVNRFRAQAGKASLVQSRLKQLEKMPERQALSQVSSLDFKFNYAPVQAKTILEAKNIAFHFDPKVPLIDAFKLSIHNKDRIGIIGKNGKGKSTLLKLLAGELAPLSGEIAPHSLLKLGYFGQTNIERLHPKLTIEDEITSVNRSLSRTVVRTICGLMMFSGDAAEKRISVLSGGEKSRVLLGKILVTPANLLLLDEPTHHLDMDSIDSLIDSIEKFPGAVAIVTHSELILRKIATKLVVFHHGGVDVFNGNYDDFLKQVGWEEEGAPEKDTPSPIKPIPATPLDKKELRQRKAELLAEKTKVLGPLKKEMERLEKKIVQLEDHQKAINSKLLIASQEGNASQLQTLSQALSIANREIEEAFERLSQVTIEYDQKLVMYD